MAEPRETDGDGNEGEKNEDNSKMNLADVVWQKGETNIVTGGKPSTRLPPGRLAEQEPTLMRQPLCRNSVDRCSHAVLSQKARHVSHSGLMSHFARQKNFGTNLSDIRNYFLETACIFTTGGKPSTRLPPRRLAEQDPVTK